MNNSNIWRQCNFLLPHRHRERENQRLKRIKSLLTKPWAAYTFAACSAVLLYMLLSHLPEVGAWLTNVRRFLSPIFIGIVVAYLMNPVSDFFEFKAFSKVKNRTAAHLWSVICTVVFLVLVLALLLVALIPSLIQSISSLVSNWNAYTEKVMELLEKAVVLGQRFHLSFDMSNITDLVQNGMDKLVDWLKNNVQTILQTAGSVGTSVSNFAIGLLFGVCFLVAEKGLVSLLNVVRAAIYKKEKLERHNELLRRCNNVFLRYIGCTVMDAAIMGVGALVFMLIMRMPYAALIAAVVAITNVIPTFGPMIGSVIGMFFLVLDKPLNALWFFIFICIWQGIDGMLIKPRLFKGSLGIPAVWTMVLIILGGKVAGMLGIILAIPAAAILVILYQETIRPRLDKRIEKNGEGLEPQSAACEEADAADTGT